MSVKTNKTVRLVYACVLSCMTFILGALLIWQVLDIYLTGVLPGEKYVFIRSDVISRLSRVSPAFWIWLIMIVAGAVMWEVFPVASKKTAYKDSRYILMRLKKRMPESVGEELQASFSYVKNQEKLIKILWLCCAVVGLAGTVYAIVYLAMPSHFHGLTHATSDMVDLAKNLVPFAFAAFAVACGIGIYEGISAKRQLEHVKKLVAGNTPAAVTHGRVYEVLHHKYFILGLRIAIACVAVAFIIAGSLNGNVLNVLDKAINICSECIGLG